jgi:hypothetical protein
MKYNATDEKLLTELSSFRTGELKYWVTVTQPFIDVLAIRFQDKYGNDLEHEILIKTDIDNPDRIEINIQDSCGEIVKEVNMPAELSIFETC